MMKTIIAAFIIVVTVAGCSSAGTSKITDSTTKPTMNTITKNELDSTQMVYNHNYDNMDRGNHDLEGQVAIDLKYYNENAINRGDIVYYKNSETNKNPGEYSISRIIGLPGEKVEIEKGQIYINGKWLDTFYGRAHRLGHDLVRLKKSLENKDLEEHIRINIENNINYFQNLMMKEIEVPESSVYVVDDDWSRSKDSRLFGPIPADSIEGKVLGAFGGSAATD
jgi:signal peptidase I